jgi:integrase
LLKHCDVEFDREGNKRTIYSLRHTYTTFRLYEGVDHYALAKNMGTSVEMIEKFYGHTSNLRQVGELTKSSNRAKVESIFDFLAP